MSDCVLNERNLKYILFQGFGGLSGLIMTSFVVHLLSTKKISEDSYSYQIFRNILTELGKTNQMT